jgi:thiosulfate dehydrogenase [quinone] large subunit
MAYTDGASIEQKTAYALLRLAVGVDFCGHGFVRILHGNAVFAQWMVKQMAETPLPSGFVYGFGWVLPFVEVLLGLLLVAGLWTRQVVVAGALLMLMLMVGISFRQDWSTIALQLFYSFLFSVLLFLRGRYDASWVELVHRG